MYRIGVDVGGTFTDFACRRRAAAPASLQGAVHAGRSVRGDRRHRARCCGLGLASGGRRCVGHGTTVATNLVIEQRGAPTGLLTTRGFRDMLEIGRQDRPHLFDYMVAQAEPLVPRELPLRGRRADRRARRVLRRWTRRELDARGRRSRRAAWRRSAICFLHAYRNPAHEQAVKAASCAARCPRLRERLARGAAGIPRVRAAVDDGAQCLRRARAMERYLERFLDAASRSSASRRAVHHPVQRRR